MAKVYGFHEVRLRPGITGQDVEEFYREELKQALQIESWEESHLLKKREGPRGDDYVFVVVFDSATTNEKIEADWVKWKEDHPGVVARWRELTAVSGEGEGTLVADYEIVE